MNIFYTSRCPMECAKFLSKDRKRHNKMILETAQLLSTSIHINKLSRDDWKIYKPTHINHPCAKWVSSSFHNHMWLFHYLLWLGKFYFEKYDVFHKSYALSDNFDIRKYGYDGNIKFATTPPNCARNKKKGLDFSHLPICEAYKKYLEFQWENK